MNWLESIQTAGAWVLSSAQLLVHLLYVISTPLRWPLYYIYASILFLLSPIWALLKLGLGAVSIITALVAKFKVCLFSLTSLSTTGHLQANSWSSQYFYIYVSSLLYKANTIVEMLFVSFHLLGCYVKFSLREL